MTIGYKKYKKIIFHFALIRLQIKKGFYVLLPSVKPIAAGCY